MNTFLNRRNLLKAIAAAAGVSVLGSPVLQALAGPETKSDEFFIFVHMTGGWDVMLWSDPRNAKVGLVDPPTDENLKTDGLKHWIPKPYANGVSTFKPVKPAGSNITFGPAIGDMRDLYDRICLIKGIAMNTVSHPDGIVYSATGAHIVGSRAVSPSIDTIMANELGTGQLFPAVSARFPSWFVDSNVAANGGSALDRRARPVIVDTIGVVGRSLTRSPKYDQPEDRDQITQLLIDESKDLAANSYYPDNYESLGLQYESMRKVLANDIRDVFTATDLKIAQPNFNYNGTYHAVEAVGAAFAVEAMKRNLVRCVSLGLPGFDTHVGNYTYHAYMLQEAFDLLAQLVKELDNAPHPTLPGHKLADHTHILVISEFCRGPMLNAAGGRDHYPNNSALVISPRFKGNTSYGETDLEQLLPVATKTFADGLRNTTPADVLATFVSAFGVDPRNYLRDGESIQELLAV